MQDLLRNAGASRGYTPGFLRTGFAPSTAKPELLGTHWHVSGGGWLESPHAWPFFTLKMPRTITRWSKHEQNTCRDWDGAALAAHCCAGAVGRGVGNHAELLWFRGRNSCLSIILGREGKYNANSVLVTHRFCHQLYSIAPWIRAVPGAGGRCNLAWR